mmetsp:Transcript_59963/g.111186  ORF Transcript_59963/g.111186 Transcript_59963/m.111186 type:complete len:662 (-) Transcript_59963:160-2145(-)
MVANHKIVCARAARAEYAGAYKGGVRDYRDARLTASVCSSWLLDRFPDSLPLAPLRQLFDVGVADMAWSGSVCQENASACSRSSNFKVMARKRPVQAEEKEIGQYDSVSIEGKNNAVVVHDGRVHRDGRTLYMVHSRYCLDRIFSEVESNARVYTEAAKPLLEAVLKGNRSTFILFGQTGTGKTHTAQGVLDGLMADIFAVEGVSVRLSCYELAGTRGGREGIFDLLAEKAAVKCLTGADGQVHVRGAVSRECASQEELSEAIAIAMAWRSSESTERNQASSRSHAIFELHLSQEADGEGGVFRIIDLAGSERNYETVQHTRSMAERGGHINYSLLMLKECARLMHRNAQRQAAGKENDAKQQHVPFRSSRLTHLLQSCFTDESHTTTVVATLSPTPVDVEHSLNTLKHVAMMRAARAWEVEGIRPSTSNPGEAHSGGNKGSLIGFSEVGSRGHGLHSTLQDARAGQLKHRAFDMVTTVGGSIQKRYDPENLKQEAFIDPRWHKEMKVKTEEADLWVLREADDEVVQVLSAWREEQWRLKKAHDLVKWDAATLTSFIRSLDLPGEVRVPSTMTGAQFRRLGQRGMAALCSDAETAAALNEALLDERAANDKAAKAHADSNARMAALAASKVHVTVPAQSTAVSAPPTPTGDEEPSAVAPEP